MPDEVIDKKEEESTQKTTIFSVRTTIGQEKSVLQNMFNRLKILRPFPNIKAIMVVEQLRGYVFVEAVHQRDVLVTIAGMKHVKGKILGSIKLEEIEHIIVPRRVTEILEVGDIVEITRGLFAGKRAEVTRMPRKGAKEEVSVKILGEEQPITVKMHGDYLKLIQKGEKHQEEYIIKEMEKEEEEEEKEEEEIFSFGEEEEEEDEWSAKFSF